MIINAETLPKLNLTRGFLTNIGSELKCCLNNKWINNICPTSATMSMKVIQIPYAPIKPCKDSDHHQVLPWTLNLTGCIRTTEKLVTTDLWYSWNMQIYQLPKLCSLWIYIDKYIICQNFVFFGYIVIKKFKSIVR